MKKYLKTISYIIISILVGITAVYATSKLTPPDAVSNTMYSLSDIYNLASGTTTDEGTGAIPTTPSLSETGKTLTEVYTAISTEIAKLSSSVIASGTTAFGITGNTNVVDTSSGDATEDHILTGKIAWVGGEEVTGVATAGTNYGIPKTGQTSCWDASGNLVSCTGTGMDGEYQFGLPESETRFIDNGDGTILDNATGLEWKKCSEGLSGIDCTTGSVTGMNWVTALTTCEADNTANHTDWRLPNVYELFTLNNMENSNPSINITFFPNTSAVDYYSSTSRQNTGGPGHSYVKTINFTEGSMNTLSKNDSYIVRCVR